MEVPTESERNYMNQFYVHDIGFKDAQKQLGKGILWQSMKSTIKQSVWNTNAEGTTQQIAVL